MTRRKSAALRLEQGGRIDRSEAIAFRWDNQTYQGFAGDTLASALMANGESVFGRSFKYHRPRGIMSAGVEESGAIVTVGRGDQRDPNVKATTQEIYSGLNAYGQNAWPNVRTDLGAVNSLMSRFLPPASTTRPLWVYLRWSGVRVPVYGCSTKN